MAQQEKPTLRQFNGDKIPAELKANKRWAPWKAVWNPKRGKYDKIPCTSSGLGLSTAKPDKWFTYEQALQAYERNPGAFSGLGYLMTGTHGITGLDLDNCVKGNQISQWAQEIIDKAATYTELSPSGTGVRMFVKGTSAVDWTNHDVGIEVYSGHEPRFLTITGARLRASVAHIAEAQPLLTSLQETHAVARSTAQVIDLSLPDLLPAAEIPSLDDLDLTPRVRDFLADGTVNGDRSRTLHTTGVELYLNRLNDAQVLSIMESNQYCMEVALDHRRQDHDRALMYLWVEHCQKAKPKAESSIVTPDEFDQVGPGATEGAANDNVADDFDDVSGESPSAPPKPPRFKPLQAAEFMASVKPLSWFVRGLLPKAEVGVVYGESGGGKSFFVLDLMMAVARAVAWKNHKTKSGRVVYVVAEGSTGFRYRMQAYANHHDVDLSTVPFYPLAAAPSLLEKTDVKDLIAGIKSLGQIDIIVIDTLAQVTAGADENSGQDMGRALKHCKTIHQATGAMVLLVAHSGKDVSRGIRGWSGIKGALDVEILVERSGRQRAATVTKMKDGTGEGIEHAFTLDVVDVDEYVDPEDGEVITETSCVLKHGGSQTQGAGPEKLTRQEHRDAWERLEPMLELADEMPMQSALDAIAAMQQQPELKYRNKAASRILDVLIKSRRVSVDGTVLRKVANV